MTNAGSFLPTLGAVAAVYLIAVASTVGETEIDFPVVKASKVA